MNTAVQEFVAAILIDSKGNISLQQRDNKPGIKDPGKVSLFAGKLKVGESRLEGLKREVYEETRFVVNGSKFLFSFHARPPKHNPERISHVYLINIGDRKVTAYEGSGVVLIRKKSDMAGVDFASITEDILNKYFEQYAHLS